jgi:hypothetical protein
MFRCPLGQKILLGLGFTVHLPEWSQHIDRHGGHPAQRPRFYV